MYLPTLFNPLKLALSLLCYLFWRTNQSKHNGNVKLQMTLNKYKSLWIIVVYFHQLLGTAYSKHWLNSAFSALQQCFCKSWKKEEKQENWCKTLAPSTLAPFFSNFHNFAILLGKNPQPGFRCRLKNSMFCKILPQFCCFLFWNVARAGFEPMTLELQGAGSNHSAIMLLSCIWGAKHPIAGQNIPQIISLLCFKRLMVGKNIIQILLRLSKFLQ